MTRVYQATDIGPRRELNEDAVAVIEGGTFIVADGMGGYAAGEVASHILVAAVRESLKAAERIDEFALRDAVLYGNQSILTTVRNHPSYSGMGTTATLCHAGKGMAFWAHVGDSRLYHLHDGALRQITRDHSLVSDLVASGTITPEQAREHPKRNVITRAVGVGEYLDVDAGSFSVAPGDVLLLASDGLTTVVSDEVQKDFGLTYLFISHDLSVVEHISDTVGVMYLGSMVEYAETEKIFANPLNPYTKALFSAIPIPDPAAKINRIILEGSIPSPANPPSGCKFHTRCRECMEVCRYAAPEWLEVEEGHFCACHLYDDAEAKARAEQVMAEAKAKEKEAAETAKKEAG